MNFSEPFAFSNMRRSSTANHFADNNLVEMIKFVSNEPSLGLHYLQKHIQNSTPRLINLKHNVIEKSHETALHGEDLEDSITMAKSMKACGIEVVGSMIREIEKSLSTLSKKQLERGSLHKSSSGFIGKARSEPPVDERTRTDSYISSVLKSVKQKGGSLYLSGSEEPPIQEEANRVEIKKMHIDPSLMMHERAGSVSDLLLLCDGYDEFKAVKEAKLEEWLQSVGNDIVRTNGKPL